MVKDKRHRLSISEAKAGASLLNYKSIMKR
jgi:hypothetical protein